VRGALALLALGVLCLAVQSVAGIHLPQGAVPDLSLLVVVAAGLLLPVPAGACISVLLGYAVDLMSGALLGQHALLRLVAYAGTKLANRRLDLRRPLPLSAFVAALTIADTLGVVLTTRALGGRAPLELGLAPVLGLQILVNAAAAPLISALASAVLRWVTPEDSARRVVRLEPRRKGA
jgi:rod shape-determining protein MreD